MTWNYRVMRPSPHPRHGQQPLVIVEVYYDDNGDIDGWTSPREPCGPAGDTLAELAEDLEHMTAALALPVLEEAAL